MPESKKTKKWKMWILVAASAGLIFGLLLFVMFGVYRFNWNNNFFAVIEKTIPFPAVYVRGAGFVSVNEIKADNAAVKKFYESQDFEKLGMRVDFSTEQGKKRLRVREKEIIGKIIENEVIEDLGKKRGIVFSDAAVSAEIENNIQQFGNKDNLMSDLARLYGCAIADFEQKGGKPELYADKLN